MTDIPNAIEIRALPPDEFMVEVWRAIPERPCITPERLVFRLRDECMSGEKPKRRELYEATWQLAPEGSRECPTYVGAWFGYLATVYEQIACCLVALGKWRVE